MTRLDRALATFHRRRSWHDVVKLEEIVAAAREEGASPSPDLAAALSALAAAVKALGAAISGAPSSGALFPGDPLLDEAPFIKLTRPQRKELERLERSPRLRKDARGKTKIYAALIDRGLIGLSDDEACYMITIAGCRILEDLHERGRR